MKKVIALIAALSLILSFSSFIVFAQDVNESPMTNQEYYSSQAYLISQYCDGKITYSQFQERSQAVTDNYVNNNTIGGVVNSGVLNASNTVSAVSQKIGSTVQKYGEAAKDKVSGWISDFMDDYSSLSDTSTTDMKGYGALITYRNHLSNYLYYFYCDYAIISLRSAENYDVRAFGNIREIWYQNNEIARDITYYKSFPDFVASSDYNYDFHFYGDIRYDDGTKVPTDDEYIQVKDFDFTQVPENDLEQLFQNMLNELELQQPDLSTIEGLLSAIYYRLGTLDSDNDNGLLSQINSSILFLNDSISDLSTSIELSFNDLKETLSSLVSRGSDDNDKDTSTEIHEIAGTIYNVIPLEKNWIQRITNDKTNLHVEYQGKEYYLESDGTLKLDDKYYNVDMNYSSTLDEILYTLMDIRDSVSLLTEEEKKMSFDDFFDLKLTDLKTDFDENFAFKDNLKDFLDNVYNVFEEAVPKYDNGD